MRIAVASGKGGTGKTTVATSLALVSKGHVKGPGAVLFLDCDVEEPNAAIFLKPTISKREEVGIPVPEVDEETCTFCGRCADVCVWNAMAVVPGKVLVFPELCHGCGSCALVCPVGAITEKLSITGTIERGTGRGIDFAHGILNTGEAMAVPIIRELKKGNPPPKGGIVLVDASPGTSCPVVESIKDANFILLVTEPTPFGLHDLKLEVQLSKDELHIPFGVIINRDGVGDPGVLEFCECESIPILGRIPLDRRIAEVVSEGETIVDALPEYRSLFEEIFSRIVLEVKK